MTPEQRIAALERDVSTLRVLLATVIGGQQALLYGLQAVITASPELRGSAEFQRLLEQAEATLLASPATDATLDVAAEGRGHVAQLIQATFEKAESSR